MLRGIETRSPVSSFKFLLRRRDARLGSAQLSDPDPADPSFASGTPDGQNLFRLARQHISESLDLMVRCFFPCCVSHLSNSCSLRERSLIPILYPTFPFQYPGSPQSPSSCELPRLTRRNKTFPYHVPFSLRPSTSSREQGTLIIENGKSKLQRHRHRDAKERLSNLSG